MQLEVSLYPEPFYVGGVNVGLSVLMGWCALAIVIVGLVLLNLLVVRRMKAVPSGAQNVLELMVDGAYRWCSGKVGDSANVITPVVLTLMTYVFLTTIAEMFGLPAATQDLNCTIAIGLCVFVTVNVAGLKHHHGLKGRIKGLCSPSPIVFPIRVVTDCIAPCSVAIRLFANVMVAGIVMQLIYAVVPIALPAAFAAYFNIFDAGIQTFVIGLLTIIYTSEAIE
ncbi:MAG: F0F1 ATP synthase subunit A [Eubacteriales bacterium]|nr:F0F1 ATP synthase subunit A [Eubacteriales bacterium]